MRCKEIDEIDRSPNAHPEAIVLNMFEGTEQRDRET